MSKKFYVTTPIYYPSAKLHLGHAYTTIAADVIKKYKQQDGYDVFYLTGNDEHGEKMETKAKENNVTPKAYVDDIVAGVKTLWESLDIDYDKFIRTTDQDHKDQVAKIFDRLKKQGDIYKDVYEGKYCTSCESYFTDIQLINGKCPDCGGEVKIVKEESYFFKCSKYVDRLLEHIKNNEDFILPASRKNELINSFIKPGLQDLAVSRTSFKWGIPVQDDENHVIYVWIDALSNYITALGYMDNKEEFAKYWPADIHLVGKEIIRFHVIYWPMILMALELPLPKQIFAHGWLLMDSAKMSKSKGNVIYPEYLIENYGVDTIRYYLMREVPFGLDGQFTPDTYVNRINNDLANDLGNLVNRTISMTNKYFNGTVKNTSLEFEQRTWLETITDEMVKNYHKNMKKLQFSKALEKIWVIISSTNKFVDLTEPWALAKDENQTNLLEAVMYELLNAIKKIAILIYPYMQRTSKKIILQINENQEVTFANLTNRSSEYNVVEKTEIIYPRLDKEVEVAKIREEMQSHVKAAKEKLEKEKSNEITFEHFSETEMLVGKIIDSKKHPKADRLLINTVEIRTGIKQIVSGIAAVYSPEDVIGKNVLVVNNLAEVTLRGEKSEGMILCSGSGKNIKLIEVAPEVAPGTKVK